jgi:hypothetical protein
VRWSLKLRAGVYTYRSDKHPRLRARFQATPAPTGAAQGG